jgi:hypothetical protein
MQQSLNKPVKHNYCALVRRSVGYPPHVTKTTECSPLKANLDDVGIIAYPILFSIPFYTPSPILQMSLFSAVIAALLVLTVPDVEKGSQDASAFSALTYAIRVNTTRLDLNSSLLHQWCACSRPAYPYLITAEDESGILLALSHRDRVRHIHFSMLPNEGNIVTAMDGQFPILERLHIYSQTEVVLPIYATSDYGRLTFQFDHPYLPLLLQDSSLSSFTKSQHLPISLQVIFLPDFRSCSS